MDPVGLTARFQVDLLEELATIHGVGSGTKRAHAVLEASTRVFESLLGEIWREFSDEHSLLSAELSAAQFARDDFAIQLEAAERLLRLSQKTKRPRWMKVAAGVLAPILGAVALGATEGAVSARVAQEVTTRSSAFSDACGHFLVIVDEAEQFGSERDFQSARRFMEQLQRRRELGNAVRRARGLAEALDDDDVRLPKAVHQEERNLKDEIDALLDLIDAELEDDPETFVRNYVQRGDR
jgi:ubiquitin-like protein Pup